MAIKIIVKPFAEIDLDETIAWYEEREVGLGEVFLHSFRDALIALAQSPTVFRKRYKSIRAFSLKKFPFNIYYIVDKEQLSVIAIFHQKRNPKIWKRRK